MESELEPGDLVRLRHDLRALNASIVPVDGGTGVVVKKVDSFYDVSWSDGLMWLLSAKWIEKVEGVEDEV